MNELSNESFWKAYFIGEEDIDGQGICNVYALESLEQMKTFLDFVGGLPHPLGDLRVIVIKSEPKKKYSVTITLDCVVEIEANSSQEAEEKVKECMKEVVEEGQEIIDFEVVHSSIDHDLTYTIKE